MLIAKVKGYSNPIIAIFPFAWHGGNGLWRMMALRLTPENELKWYPHFIDDGHGRAKAEFYETLKIASEIAEEFNKEISERVRLLSLDEQSKTSIVLKAEKAVIAEQRLAYEEQLMLNEALKRSMSLTKPIIEQLILPEDGEGYREELYRHIRELPNIKMAYLRSHGVILLRKGDFDWSTELVKNAKTTRWCFRERIASGFGLSGHAHWGETKAKIRELLLPRANKLLQIASVQRMLDEALTKGQHVIVVGGFVFWYEKDKNVGWMVKSLAGGVEGKEGQTLWKEGKILSKNHGRIVVLPYVKSDGELVKGHTKNSPKDGKALPRHPDYYVELPFEVLEGDLMIGLFGELPYE